MALVRVISRTGVTKMRSVVALSWQGVSFLGVYVNTPLEIPE